MPARRSSPLEETGVKRPPRYIYRSLRIHPALWEQVDALAARETMSVNGLVNALLELALHQAEQPGGAEMVHAACTQWRTRWEYKVSARRRARQEG